MRLYVKLAFYIRCNSRIHGTLPLRHLWVLFICFIVSYPFCCIPRRWWVGNVEGGIALAERKALSALNDLRIEFQVRNNSQ
jgi:hypothetical protein